jgi:hypothetical protein
VRLGTCIALELAVVAGALGGVCVGVGHAIDHAGSYLTTREAIAATRTSPSPTLSRLPGASLEVPPHMPPANVFGGSDDDLLAPIGAAPLVRVKPNKGGTSLSLRLDFENGARASFKPEQIHPQSDPRREVAAYRIDRLLGIGHVPPAKPIKLGLEEVLAAADPSFRTYTTTRVMNEAIAKNGELRGMVSWWIPEIRDAYLAGVPLEQPAAQQLLLSYLQIGAEIPDAQRPLVEQVATCIVFDVIINNSDRWSGANTKMSPDLVTLYFMDNTLSFSRAQHGHEANLRPLYRMQVFPRRLVTRLRRLTHEAVQAALAIGDDPAGIGPLLTPEEMRAILSRRDNLLAHVDRLIAQHGEDAVLALP